MFFFAEIHLCGSHTIDTHTAAKAKKISGSYFVEPWLGNNHVKIDFDLGKVIEVNERNHQRFLLRYASNWISIKLSTFFFLFLSCVFLRLLSLQFQHIIIEIHFRFDWKLSNNHQFDFSPIHNI